ncbi:branched-chain amino acid aminotransferase [Abditibacterium utsteinense]|uniref:Branched-chain amino acid aminotransferase n=1 Tax=Abditibacterium utsteinense TaxID=1960156 RepID=A0A2S8SS60_9BACT|nr:aminotransferase class IV [Abditibacterium utsteinense]PQV63652.1 branched-chain amino acid aminotransferase [Abditibacterium utsteinense]
MKFWLNGKIIENSDTSGAVSARSAGLTLGWGVFTTLGVRDGAPRFLERHFGRLQRDANAADVPFDLDFPTISKALNAVLRANNIENGHARLTLTRRDDGRWNLENGADLSIFALETADSSGELRAQLSPHRTEAKRALAGVKITSYLPYFWAWREAKKRGYDEAILRDGEDVWCEGARSTIFWVKNGELFTPSLETGCLRGIGRDLALEWAAFQGIPVHQGRFQNREAETADEMWLVSAATGTRPLRALHDESGAKRMEFNGKNEMCAEFSRWLEAQSE